MRCGVCTDQQNVIKALDEFNALTLYSSLRHVLHVVQMLQLISFIFNDENLATEFEPCAA